MSESVSIRPYRIEIPQSDLDDLADRLARTRLTNELPLEVDPDAPPTGPVPPGWEYGVPVGFVRDMVERWRTGYDWRAWEARLNAYPQYRTEIDGQDVHFLHVRSNEPDALPLILTHGWPATVVEYLGLIGPLTDPAAHGGAAADAFDVVIPSIPGFGFSEPTKTKGWNRYRIARAWDELMRRLGYDRYGAHGNDAGSNISPEVGRHAPDRVVGVHVTQIFSFPSGDPAEFAGLSEEDMAALQFLQFFNENMSGFAQLQGSAPQNAAHALSDSPAGQLAWSAQLLSGTSPDFLLTNATIYWLTNTSASSGRLYYEDQHADHPTEPTTVPLGLANFAYDMKSIRRFAERDHKNIVSWNVYDRGSHWAADDAPELLVEDLRQFYRRFR
jgi:pimeloyl-ACP methyl ester carboxylesterase